MGVSALHVAMASFMVKILEADSFLKHQVTNTGGPENA
jgi:hypothetical protein